MHFSVVARLCAIAALVVAGSAAAQAPDNVVIATGVANDVLATWIDICPSSTKFCAGETLRLVVQGSDVYAYPGAGY